MEMGTRYPPGFSGPADQIPFADLRILFYTKIGEVEVHRIEAASVIQDKTLAAEKKLLSKNHPPVIGSKNFRARCGLQIDPSVRGARRSVDDPAQAEG